MRIQCNGEIVASGDKWLYDWFEIPAFCPEDLRRAIGALPEGDELVLEINSPGGNCYAGFESYSILRACGHPTVAEVQSWAASAASTILMGAQTRRVSPVGQVMIHDPWLCACGNAGDMRSAARYLDSVKESILNAYELRCRGKCDRQKLSDLMTEETWLPAQDAIALGLCDELLLAEGEDATGMMPTTAVSASVMNGTGCHNAEDLMNRYREEVLNGKRQPDEHHPVDGMPQAASCEARESGETMNEDEAAANTQEDIREDAEITADECSPTARGADNNTDWQQDARIKLEKNRF